MSAAGAAYASWVDLVHQLGGVATAWPFSTGAYGGSYGLPAARFPADTFAALAGNNLPMSNGVQFNNPGTWVYVLASAMNNGDTSVDQAAEAMTGATVAEAEQACAVNGNCPTDLEKLIKTVAIGAAVVAGAIVAVKALDIVKDWE